VEEAGQIDSGDGGEVVGRVLVEWLGDEEARVVMRVSIRPKRPVVSSSTRCAVSAWVISPWRVRKSGSSLELIERDVPTTA